MKIPSVVLGGFACVLAAAPAYAEDSPESGVEAEGASTAAPSTNATVVDWYGLAVVAADIGATSVAAGGIALTYAVFHGSKADGGEALLPLTLTGIGVLGLQLGGPIVHWVHGRVGIGFASLALRTLAPLAGVGLGALISGVTNVDQIAPSIGGGILGLVAASAIDIAVLSRTRRPVTLPAKLECAELMPTLSFERRGFKLGLGGTF